MLKKFPLAMFALLFAIAVPLYSFGVSVNSVSAEKFKPRPCFALHDRVDGEGGDYIRCSTDKPKPKNIPDLSKVKYDNSKKSLNNSISQIRATCVNGKNVTIILYDKVGYKGTKKRFSCGDHKVNLGSFSNKASSIKIIFNTMDV